MLTAKQLLALVAVVATLSGCATKKDFYATGGSRADGSVDMAHDFAQFEKPVIDIAQAQSIAKSKCRVWGYSDAEAFGGKQLKCHQSNGYGTCIAGQVIYKYQCLGDLGAAPQFQPSAAPLSATPAAAGSMGKGEWQQNQLNELNQTTGLTYEEYQKRYKAIMGQ
ncbi:YecR-like lipoprotein [Pseudomonas guineae]|uniref:YecR-like lipoprotein n=1 Tax=Pseudomonas guineae TaxID=425504 RepID=A0A1I3KCY4_9PSED|nr:YecR family lipoprotein [Pseudomonas guineae]SFI70317.1 YecR-like lipoprotein [Pseudomonas guineae]